MTPDQMAYLLGLLADTVRAQQQRIQELEAELRLRQEQERINAFETDLLKDVES